MKSLLPLLALTLCLSLSSCLTTPTASSGGAGSVTVTNTNLTALMEALNATFPQYGYTTGPANYPSSFSYDKPAGAFGKLMYGSYGVTTTIRVQVNVVNLGNNTFRLVPKVSRVSDAGVSGFEDDTRMLGMWAGQFGPVLKKVQSQATNAGPGY